jgi:hypothetical protein
VLRSSPALRQAGDCFGAKTAPRNDRHFCGIPGSQAACEPASSPHKRGRGNLIPAGRDLSGEGNAVCCWGNNLPQRGNTVVELGNGLPWRGNAVVERGNGLPRRRNPISPMGKQSSPSGKRRCRAGKVRFPTRDLPFPSGKQLIPAQKPAPHQGNTTSSPGGALPCHPITPSPCHLVTLSPCHPVTHHAVTIANSPNNS